MGSIKDVTNPIILEERKLDIKYRKKMLIKKIDEFKTVNQKNLKEQENLKNTLVKV